MVHGIEVHLSANIDKYKAGMESAKKMGSDSMGFIATIFDKIKSMFSGLWDSFKSIFSGLWDKIKSGFSSMSDSVSGAFQRIAGHFPGMHADLDKTKTKMGETEEKSSGLAQKIGVSLVAAVVAFTAVAGLMVKKGLDIGAAFASMATSSDIAVSQISRFDAAAARSDMGIKDLGGSMTKFREAMTKSAAGDGGSIFDKLGVKVADSNNALLKTDDVLVDVSKKIAGMGSEAEKYAAAAKIGFDGKVQVLEDIAHAGQLSASTTDEQAAATVRLGKIWHEILPAGKSMWTEISEKLTNSLTPAMTDASIAMLESKNKIVQAFEQIYGGGSFLDKLGAKIQSWSKDASAWFAGVTKSTTEMTVSLMQWISLKTGFGDPFALKPGAPRYVPGPVKLTSDKSDPVAKAAEEEARKQFDATNKSVAERIEIMTQQIKVGATLTEGQLALLKVEKNSLGLKPEEKKAAIEQAQALDALDKQFKTQQDAKAAAAAAAKKEQEVGDALISSTLKKIAAGKLELSGYDQLSESQKLAIELAEDIRMGKIKQGGAVDLLAQKLIAEKKAQDEQIAAGKQYAEAMKAINAAGDGDLKSLDELIAKQRQHNEEIGKTPEQIELARQAQAEAQAADAVREAQTIDALLNQADLQGILIGRDRDLYAARLAYLDGEIQKRNTLAGLHADGATNEAVVKAVADAAVASKKLAEQAIQDWRDAGSSIADSLSSAFSAGGNAIGQMFKAYADGQAAQLRAQKELAEAKLKLDTDPEKVAAIQHAQQMGFQAQIKSYGDMASAAKGFFKENTTGYKLMEGAEKAFRLVELASQMESLYTHLFVTTAKAAATTGGQAVETAAVGAGEAERNALKVPGVFMSFMSALGPYGAAAAAVAIAAVLGGAFSGGHGVDVAKQRQESQGAGTVLGDSSAKSDSIAHSVAMTAANSSTQINYLAGMLTSLQAIQTNIGSFASQIVQNTNISNPNVHLNTNNGFASTVGTLGLAAGGAALGGMAGAGLSAFTAMGAVGGPVGMVIGAVAGAILSKIPAIANLMTSIFGGKQSVADSGFMLDKTSLASVLSGGVNAKTYADVTTSGGWFSSDKTSTQSTGLGADANKQFGLIISSLADSIKQAGGLLGVSGDDFTAKLNSFVIDIGKVSLKGLTGDEQQKALEAVFSKLGDQMAEWAVDGLGQFAKVGEGYLETLTRVATDYAKLDASLASVGMTFGSVGIASVGVRENLIALAGGIDKFQSDTASFAQNFLSKAEQLAPVQKFVDDQLAAMGLSFIKSRDQFKDEALGLDLTTAAGQKEYAALMSLQAAFAATHAATVDLTKNEQEIADERKGLQDQLDQLTMTSIQLREKERAGIDSTNLALYDNVQAATAAKAAIEQAQASAAAAQAESLKAKAEFSSGLSDFFNKMADVARTLRSFSDSLNFGSLSPLSKSGQYDMLKGELSKAQPQDVQAIASAFLQASKDRNGSNLAYAHDFAMTQQLIVKAAATQDQRALDMASFFRSSIPFMADGSHAGGLASVPFDGYRAILHKDEGVLTATENRQYRAPRSAPQASSGMSEATAQRLIAAIEKMQGSSEDAAKHARTTANILQRVTKDGKSLITTAN